MIKPFIKRLEVFPDKNDGIVSHLNEMIVYVLFERQAQFQEELPLVFLWPFVNLIYQSQFK